MSEERKEGGSQRGWGDYTIIQITAGYNLVADVSRSTMPTTHRRACVCAYTLKEFQCPASGRGANGEKRPHEKSTLNIAALYHSFWEGGVLFFGREGVSNADEIIYENNDREADFLHNGGTSKKHTRRRQSGDLFAFLFLRQLSEKQNLKPEEFCARRREVRVTG